MAPNAAGDTWGVGYYADDRALIIRKPGDLLAERGFYELAVDVKSRILLSFVQEGSTTTVHAPPHRFRRWLFGCIGDLSPLDALRPKIEDAIPDFIRSELGDAGPRELALAMFLREQHDRGLLADPLASGVNLADAMKRTTAAMRMLADEAGIEPPQATYVASNGRTIIVSRNGPAVHWTCQEGLEALPDGPPDPAMHDFTLVVESLKRFRAIVFAANLTETAAGWTELKDGETLWVDRALEINSA